MGRSAKHAAYEIPDSIEGVSRQQTFMSMAAMLAEQGSPTLKSLIDRYALPLLQLLQRSDTVDDMLRELADNRGLEWTDILETES